MNHKDFFEKYGKIPIDDLIMDVNSLYDLFKSRMLDELWISLYSSKLQDATKPVPDEYKSQQEPFDCQIGEK